MEKLTCARAKEIDLVNYLASLGHYPAKKTNWDYWYRSPLREEKTPSFKVDQKRNIWYDHGIGKGGDLIDFGVLYFKCGISDLLKILAQQSALNLPFQPHIYSPTPIPSAGEKKDVDAGKITILDSRPLQDKNLIAYLDERKISLDIADSFCREINFELYGKKYTVIGFENRSGGYELRSLDFKGSNSPKDISFLDNQAAHITVFEGFFNFLSFCTINKNKQELQPNYLVLNSLSFLDKSRPLMEQHQLVYLMLDRDDAGISQTRKLLASNPEKYLDRSDIYKGHKDFNDYLKGIRSGQQLSPMKQQEHRQIRKPGKRL